MPWLINPTQLDNFRKNQKSLIILDASWHLPSSGRNGKSEFMGKHILDAQFFDITAFNDPNTDLPHMLLLDEKIISEKLSACGIRDDYKIIFYDNSELHTACRALWMLKVFGHNPHQLYILDGGLKAWENYGGKVDSGNVSTSPKQYTTKLKLNYLRNLQQIKTNLHQPQEQVVDLRHPVKFCGGPEDHTPMRPGHIPGSISFPYFTMFEKEGLFRPLEKIRTQLSDVAISLNHPIVTTCGSGITSAILNFVLDLMDHEQHALYDGSWSEWGSDKLYVGETSLDERPVETYLE